MKSWSFHHWGMRILAIYYNKGYSHTSQTISQLSNRQQLYFVNMNAVGSWYEMGQISPKLMSKTVIWLDPYVCCHTTQSSSSHRGRTINAELCGKNRNTSGDGQRGNQQSSHCIKELYSYDPSYRSLCMHVSVYIILASKQLKWHMILTTIFLQRCNKNQANWGHIPWHFRLDCHVRDDLLQGNVTRTTISWK